MFLTNCELPLFNIKSFIETLHDYGEDLTEAERREFLTANHETTV